MSVTLAYPAMGPILEFMEANKRINLTSRCPSLDAIDKPTPLRLDFLEFQTNCIQINKMSYQLSHCEQKYEENQSQKEDKSSREALAPGEIQIGGNKFSNFRQFVEFHIENEFGVETVRRLPENLEIHMALRKLFGFLLGSRQAIKLPENLKIWVKTLNTKKTDFEEILPILDPSCLPLETLKLENAQPHNLQNSVFQTARNLEIIRDDVEWEEDENQVEKWHSEFQKLPNKNIFMDFRFYGQERIVDLIKYWMENGKEIGTCWNFRRRYWEKLNREVKRIKKEIGGTYGRGHSLILPLNDDSELMIVGTKMPKNQLRVLQLIVQPKVDRSALTHKIINQIYSYWLFYSFLTILALMGGSIVICRIMGPNAIPLVVGLSTISFTFLWLSRLEGFF